MGRALSFSSPAAEDEPHIIGFSHEIDGSGGPALQMPAGGSRLPASHETVEQRLHYVKQDGQAVFKFAVRKMEEIALRLLSKHGIDASEIDLFVSHQANRRIITAAAERLGLPESKVIINLEMYGNTTAGTIPLALADAVAQGPSEARRPGAAHFGGCRLHRRLSPSALEPVGPTSVGRQFDGRCFSPLPGKLRRPACAHRHVGARDV